MVSKSQLAQRIAARGATPAQATHAVDAVLGEITAALAAGEKVTLLGFGSFEPVARAARTARNPRTGATVPVAAATVPRFHPGTGLRAAVGGGEVTLGAVGSLPDRTAAVAERTKAGRPAGPLTAQKPGKPAKAERSGKKDKDAKGKGKDAKGKKSGKKK